MWLFCYLFLFLNSLFQGTGGYEGGGDVRAEVGESISLPCSVDFTHCGELHSVKWYRTEDRVYVYSQVSKIARPEGPGSERMAVEYKANSTVSYLHIKKVEVTDEAVYKCEKTYMEVRENCDVVQLIRLRTQVKPQSVRILGQDGMALGNATSLGPFSEGTDIELECEAAHAKPVPRISWYNGTDAMTSKYTKEESENGIGTARSKIKVTLSRGDLNVKYHCVVESDALEEPIVSWLKPDVNVRPTRMELTGVRGHVVQGTNVLLNCNVYGARPAANVTWYNGTERISDRTIDTSVSLMDDGTWTTQSDLVFAASRFENGHTLICEAENSVLREHTDRPMHQRLTLEVLYPPIVTVGPENTTMNESSNILLLCNYIANPAKIDSVKWLKNKQVLQLNDDHYKGGTVENPPLIIKNMTREDAGDYSCVLKNSVGSSESWNVASLNIHYKPMVELTMEPSNIVKAKDHINVTLQCEVTSGNPDTLLQVRWYLNGRFLKEIPDPVCTTNDINSDRTFCDVDPSRLFLEYVVQDFAGNYSCMGMNEAGWGLVSEQVELIVYYPPSEAIVQYEPKRIVKKASVSLSCAVEQPGRPDETKYLWYRGAHLLQEMTAANWTISPVTLETKTNFTCVPYNEGGHGESGTVSIDVLAPPAFIIPLQPYTGARTDSHDIHLSCRIECSPMCTVSWLKDGRSLEHNPLYYVNNTVHPADLRTNDFESIHSVLHWNMTAWPNERLDRIYDNANYTCQSSTNGVGPGVTSTTLFAIEFPPENITVSNRVVSVIENHIPERVICNAKAHPEVSYSWRREGHNDVISKGNALMLGAVTRSSAGNYVCEATNRHGSTTHKTFLNIMYKPECAITQTELDGRPALVCTAHANPKEVSFTWGVKGLNETPTDLGSAQQHGLQSYLLLDTGVDTFRTYLCCANNSVGESIPCERDVAGMIPWWRQLDNENLLIIIAIIVGIVVCIIIICIIIVIVCRRKRANNKCPSPSSMADKGGPQASLGPNDPLTDPEKTFYENLPFHGMQNPPNKPMSVITPFVQDSQINQSTPDLSTSTKSLMQSVTNPLSSPVALHANKIQRNQSFAGFQAMNSLTDPTKHNAQTQINDTRTQVNYMFPSYYQSRSNVGYMNQIYSSNQFVSRNAFSIISPPNLRYPNRFSNVINHNPLISPPRAHNNRLRVLSEVYRTGQTMHRSVPVGRNHNGRLSHNASFSTTRKIPPTLPQNQIFKSRSDSNLPDALNSDSEPKTPKFGSLDQKCKHKCNSPMFYSVRCRKHGKKRTIFELYTLPVESKTKSNSSMSDSEVDARKRKTKATCVVVSEIPKTPKSTKASTKDNASYQNLTDSIQILEQNSENSVNESLNSIPKPAPRCRKSPNNIYQNISILLREKSITPNEDKPNESNTKDTNVVNMSTSTQNNNNEMSNQNITNNINERVVGRSENKYNTKLDKTAYSGGQNESVNQIPKSPKVGSQNSDSSSAEPKDYSDPALIPQMPLLHTSPRNKSLSTQNPFYTLTTPNIKQLTTSQHLMQEQHFSSTFPHQRNTRLVPRALFQDQQINKSKSFSTKPKQKKHFQIPLQKCHSFKFQTAESYFQPIKNIHEENFMRNGYQSDIGPNYSREYHHKRDRHKNPKPVILRRSSDTENFEENRQFHEKMQNSVQLQYPQPLYASKHSAPKKNGVVYADLDMDSKSDTKRAEADLKKAQKARTEYATLKFDDIGQEIDV